MKLILRLRVMIILGGILRHDDSSGVPRHAYSSWTVLRHDTSCRSFKLSPSLCPSSSTFDATRSPRIHSDVLLSPPSLASPSFS